MDKGYTITPRGEEPKEDKSLLQRFTEPISSFADKITPQDVFKEQGGTGYNIIPREQADFIRNTSVDLVDGGLQITTKGQDPMIIQESDFTDEQRALVEDLKMEREMDKAFKEAETSAMKTGKGGIPVYGALDVMSRGIAGGITTRKVDETTERQWDNIAELRLEMGDMIRQKAEEGDKEGARALLDALKATTDDIEGITTELVDEAWAKTPTRQQVAGAGLELAVLASMGYGIQYGQAGVKGVKPFVKVPRISKPFPLGASTSQKIAHKAKQYGLASLRSGAELGIWSAAGEMKIEDATIEDIIGAAEEGFKFGAVLGPAFHSAGDLTKLGLGKFIPKVKDFTTKTTTRLERIAAGKEKVPKNALEKALQGIEQPLTKSQRAANVALKGIDFAKKAEQRLLDSFAPIRRIEDSIRRITKRPNKGGEVLYRDIRMANPWADGISEKKINHFAKTFNRYSDEVQEGATGYLNLLNNLDRVKMGLKVPGGKTAGQIKREIGELAILMGKDNMKKIGQIRKAVNKYTQGELSGMVRAGLIDEKQMLAMMKAHPNYLPNKVIMDGVERHSKAVGSSMNVSETSLKKAVGSIKEIENPIEAMLSRTIITNRVKEKNKILQNLIKAHKDYKVIPGAKPLQTSERVIRRKEIFGELKGLKKELNVTLRRLKTDKRLDRAVGRKIADTQKNIKDFETKFAKELTKYMQEGVKVSAPVAEKATTRIIPRALEDLEIIARQAKNLNSFGKMANVKKAFKDGLLERHGFKSIKSFYEAAKHPFKKTDPKILEKTLKADIEKVIKMAAGREKSAKQLEILKNIDKVSTQDAVNFLTNVSKSIKSQRKELWQESLKLSKIKKGTGEQTISFYKDGIKEIWQVPENIASAIKSTDMPIYPGWWRAVTAPTRALKAGATTYSLGFILRNKARDTHQAAIIANSFIKDTAKKYGFSPKNAKNYSRKQINETYKQGGWGASIFEDGEDALRKLMERGKVSTNFRYDNIKSVNPFTAIKKLNNMVEQSTRKETLARAMNAGLSKKDAVWVSRNATVDFTKMGTWMRPANQAIPFLNARVQGLAKLPEAFLQSPERFTEAIMNTAVLPTLLLHQHNRRYESYKYINQGIKDLDWIIMTGEVPAVNPYTGDEILVPQFVQIKRGEGQNFVSSPIRHWLEKEDEIDHRNVSQMMADMFGSNSPVDFGTYSRSQQNLWGSIAAQFGPIPTMVMGGSTGQHPYWGSDIIPEYRQDLHQDLQFGTKTPGMLKDIPKEFYRSGFAETLNISPGMLEFYVGVFGGMPQDVLKATDIAYGVIRGDKMGGLNVTDTTFETLSEIPVIKGFLKQTTYNVTDADRRLVSEVEKDLATDDREIKDRADEIIHKLRTIKDPKERKDYFNLLGDELTLELITEISNRAGTRAIVDGLSKTDRVDVRAKVIQVKIQEMKDKGHSNEKIREFIIELTEAGILNQNVINELLK